MLGCRLQPTPFPGELSPLHAYSLDAGIAPSRGCPTIELSRWHRFMVERALGRPTSLAAHKSDHCPSLRQTQHKPSVWQTKGKQLLRGKQANSPRQNSEYFSACRPLTRRACAGRSKETPTNPRGIPYAPFVDRVEDYVTSRADTEPTLRKFQEMIA